MKRLTSALFPFLQIGLRKSDLISRTITVALVPQQTDESAENRRTKYKGSQSLLRSKRIGGYVCVLMERKRVWTYNGKPSGHTQEKVQGECLPSSDKGPCFSPEPYIQYLVELGPSLKV